MKRWTGGVMILALLVLGAPDLTAQRGRRGPGIRADRGRVAGVERVLRLREQLELSEAQIEELDAIRREGVQRQAAQQAERAELESRLRAGQIERVELRDPTEARRESRIEEAAAQTERVDVVLTDAQRESLDQLGVRRRAFVTARASARRGGRLGIRPGGRGFEGSQRRPGMRGGRRSAPGMRRGQAPGARGSGSWSLRGRSGRDPTGRWRRD